MKVKVLLEGLDLLLLWWLRVYLRICLPVQLLGFDHFCHQISGDRELYLQLVLLHFCLHYFHLRLVLVLLIELYPFHLKTLFSAKQAACYRRRWDGTVLVHRRPPEGNRDLETNVRGRQDWVPISNLLKTLFKIIYLNNVLIILIYPLLILIHFAPRWETEKTNFSKKCFKW